MGPFGIRQHPTHKVSDIAVQLHSSGDSIEVTGRIAKRAIPGHRMVGIFFGRDDGVSNLPMHVNRSEPTTHFSSVPCIASADKETFTMYVPLDEMTSPFRHRYGGVASGQTVYVRAYPAVNFDPKSYYVPDFGTGPEGSNVVSFVMP